MASHRPRVGNVMHLPKVADEFVVPWDRVFQARLFLSCGPQSVLLATMRVDRG